MIKTNCKRFNTAREYLEEDIRIWRSDVFYYKFNEYGHRIMDIWDSPSANTVDNAQEMIEIALKHLEKFGHVCFEGLGGISHQMGGGYQETYDCKIDNSPRATKKEITKLARLNELVGVFSERYNKTKTWDERMLYLRGRLRISKLTNNLKKKYDWRDEMFRENGLVGLRNVNGDVLVPCGDYDFIHGCDYWDDTSFAIASRNGMYGLVKRDGKGTVVTPFNYVNIELESVDYYSTSEKYNIHIGYRKTDRIVRDMIVNGEIIVSGANWISSFEKGVIVYGDKEKNKYGFLGIYWDWLLTEPIFDEVIIREFEPITFIKDGERGVLTTNKEFISLEKWDSMTDEQQEELWNDKIVGYQL